MWNPRRLLTLVYVLVFLLKSSASKAEEIGLLEPDGPEIEACPLFGLPDSEKSACYTRVFKQQILPYLKTGIPQYGIRSLDPVTVSKLSITFVDIGIIRWITHVHDLVITGCSNMSRSDFVFDSQNRQVTVHMKFPRIEGKSDETRVEGHIFGIPVQRFVKRDPHSISFRVDELSIWATYVFPQTESELIRISELEHEIKGFVVEQNGLLSPLREEFVNWMAGRLPFPKLPPNLRASLDQIFIDIFTTTLDENAWRVIKGDLPWLIGSLG